MCALVVATLLAIPPRVGAEPAQEGTVPAPDQGALWRDAQAKLETADYSGAIVSLTTLYELVVHDPEAEALRNRVRVSLQAAHVGAYGVDSDRQHLVAALDLIDRTIESLPETEQGQRESLGTRRDEIQAMLQAHAEPEPEPEPEPDSDPDPDLDPEFEPELDPAPTPDPEPRVDPSSPPESNGRALIITGAVLAGVGLVGNGLLIGGLVSANSAVDTFETEPRQRADARRNITRGNTIGIVGGAVGGAFTVAGAVLLTLGLRKRQSNVSPMVDQRAMGVSWSGRF